MSKIDFENLLRKLVDDGKLEEIHTDTIRLFRLRGRGHLWATKDQIENALEVLLE